jgi:hypothetical protein
MQSAIVMDVTTCMSFLHYIIVERQKNLAGTERQERTSDHCLQQIALFHQVLLAFKSQPTHPELSILCLMTKFWNLRGQVVVASEFQCHSLVYFTTYQTSCRSTRTSGLVSKVLRFHQKKKSDRILNHQNIRAVESGKRPDIVVCFCSFSGTPRCSATFCWPRRNPAWEQSFLQMVLTLSGVILVIPSSHHHR